MKCPKCGAEAGTAKFCPECGFMLAQVSVNNACAEHRFPDFGERPPQNILNEIPNNEKISGAIHGRFSEWLICTDRCAHIVKSGFATGSAGQVKHFQIEYQNIDNAFVEFHLTTGYFEILASGAPRIKKTYWGGQDANPQISLNSIGIDKIDVNKFEEACKYINAKSVEAKAQVSPSQNASSKSSDSKIQQTFVHKEDKISDCPTPLYSSVRCPKCGSSDLQVFNEVRSKGVSGTKVCLFGICGLCGAGKTTNEQYWICKHCGYKFKA